MIRYTLKCARGHAFDSWFNSAASFDKLQEAGMISCTVCGEERVEKAVMAPQVRPAERAAAQAPAPGPHAEACASAPVPAPVPAAGQGAGRGVGQDRGRDHGQGPLSRPASQIEAALRELRRRIEATSEDVGRNFAREARAIHAGEAPERPIIGEAHPAEARSLIEDGIPVAPLPWPARKPN